MKILSVGSGPQTLEKISLAVRLRWPDAEFIVSGGEVEDAPRTPTPACPTCTQSGPAG